MMKALVFDDFGGPEVLSVREVAEPERSKSAVIVRMKDLSAEIQPLIHTDDQNLFQFFYIKPMLRPLE